MNKARPLFRLGLAIAALSLPWAIAMAQGHSVPEPSGPSWKNGEQVYRSACIYCHESPVAPELLGRELPPPLITTIVRSGLRAMPAFRAAEIDDQALADLAEYISTH